MGRSHTTNTVALTTGSVILTGYPLSVSLWLKMRDVSTVVGATGIVDVGVGAHSLASVLINYPTGGKITGQVYNQSAPAIANTFFTSTITIAANEWYHVLFSLGLGTGNLWVNGGYVGANTWIGTPNSMTDTYALGCNGDVSQVCYWSAALDVTEANRLHAGCDPRRIRPESIAAYWPLNRSDRSETGRYHFTPSNSPSWSDDPPQTKRRRVRRAGTVATTHALTATGVATGAPSVGSPALGQVHALTATGVATGAPSVGSPALGQIHALTATGVATAAPSVGSPAIGQIHALTATGVATGAPSVGSPSLGQVHALTATGVSSGAPTVGAPAVGQIHTLTADSVASGAPSVGSPAISQTHSLTADGVASGAPTTGSPSLGQSHALEATGVAAGAPTVGEPVLGQVHALTATGVATGTPSVGSPALGQVHALVATGVATGTPSVGSPALSQVHALTASGVATGTPSVGSPELGQSGGTVSLVAVGVDSGIPSVGAPALSQIHALIALAIASGGPTVGSPTLSIVTDFVCVDTITLHTPKSVATLGTACALASGATCEGAATMGVPRSSARLYCPKANAFQRPC